MRWVDVERIGRIESVQSTVVRGPVRVSRRSSVEIAVLFSWYLWSGRCRDWFPARVTEHSALLDLCRDVLRGECALKR